MNPYQQAIDGGLSDQQIAEYLSQDQPEKLETAINGGLSYQQVAQYLSDGYSDNSQADRPEGAWGALKTGVGNTKEEKPVEFHPIDSLFRGYQTYIPGMIGGLTGMVGSGIESDRIRDWGYDLYESSMGKAGEHPKSIEFKDALNSPAHFASWAGESIIEFIPQMASMMVGGKLSLAAKGISGVKTGISSLLKNKIKKEAVKLTAKGVAKEKAIQLSKKKIIDQTLLRMGAGAQVTGMYSGSSWGEAKSRFGEDDPKSAALTGLGTGAVTFLIGGQAAIIEAVLGSKSKAAFINAMQKGDKSILTRIAKQFFEIAPKAAGEEFAQESMATMNAIYHDPEVDKKLDSMVQAYMDPARHDSFKRPFESSMTVAVAAGLPAAVRQGAFPTKSTKPKDILSEAKATNARLAGVPEEEINAIRQEEEIESVYNQILGEIKTLESMNIQGRETKQAPGGTPGLDQAKQANEDILTPGVDPQPNIQTEDPVAIEQRKQREIIGLQTRLANINKKENLTEKDKERLVKFKDRVNTLLNVTPTVEGAFAVPVNEDVDEAAIQEAGLNKEFDTEFQKRGEAQKAQATIKADIQKQRELNVDKAESTIDYKQRNENQKKIDTLSEHGETLNNLGYAESDLLEMDRKTIANIAKRSMPKGVSNTRPKGDTKPITDIKVARSMAKRLNKKDGGKREAIKFNDTEYGWVDRTTPEGKNVSNILDNVKYQKLSPDQKLEIDQEKQAKLKKTQDYQAKLEATKTAEAERLTEITRKESELKAKGIPTGRLTAESQKNYYERIEKDYERLVVNAKSSVPVVEKPILVNGKVLEEVDNKAEEPDMTDAFDGTFEQYKEKTKRYYEHYDQTLPSEAEMEADFEAGKPSQSDESAEFNGKERRKLDSDGNRVDRRERTEGKRSVWDAEFRKKYGKPSSEMTKEEMQEALTHDSLTNLHNDRGFWEDIVKSNSTHIARLDMDNLHDHNEVLSYDGSDQLIKAIGKIARENGIYVAREKGDEFLSHGSLESLKKSMKELTDILDSYTIEVTNIETGKTYLKTGIGVSYGIEQTPGKAEIQQKLAKAKKLAEGKRIVGRQDGSGSQLPGLVEITPEGQKPGKSESQDLPAQVTPTTAPADGKTKEQSEQVLTETKNTRVIDKSVRDNTQHVIIKNGTIKITNKSGRKTVKATDFPLSKWAELEKSFGNPAFNKKEFIKSLNTMRLGEENHPIGERIIDAQISAINKAYKKHTGEVSETAKPESEPLKKLTGKTAEERKAHAKQIRDKRFKTKSEALKEKTPVLLNDDGSMGVIIHPSTKEPGKWQTTSWDATGFSGDIQYDTKEEAIKGGIGDGFGNLDTEGVFKKISKTEKFLDGIAATRKVQEDYAKRLKESSESKAKKEKTPTPQDKIDDFGEKLGGAKKDTYSQYTDKMATAKELDIAIEPLSKSWPEPNYQKLIDEGTDPFTVAFIRASRDEVPNKPGSSWKKKQWVEHVKLLREVSEKLLSGKITIENLKDQAKGNEALSKFFGRVELYEHFGHGKSLKGIYFAKHHWAVYKGKKNVSKWMIEKKQRATAWSNMPMELGVGNTKEEAIADFEKKYKSLDEKKKSSKGVRFILYTTQGKDGVFIGKKIGKHYVDLENFPTTKEAREYLNANQEKLEEKLANYKKVPSERRTANRDRIGIDHRQGKTVTPEMFNEEFGFRGVEFGNWVNNKERQDNLDRAYDALMDLSIILNIPPKAISLNGELGLAFGARGSGGKNAAAAHYESDKIVINLTKKNGPGSLAHEWFHGLDSYFSRGRGKKSGNITLRPYKLNDDTTRPEVLEAFKSVMEAIKGSGLPERSSRLDARRAKAYWATEVEMVARAFESYVIEKSTSVGNTNDYLANIASADAYASDMISSIMGNEDATSMDFYPYLLESEVENVKKVFDNLFDTIETKETDKGVALYQQRQDKEGNSPLSGITLKQIKSLPFFKGKTITVKDGIITVHLKHKKNLHIEGVIGAGGKVQVHLGIIDSTDGKVGAGKFLGDTVTLSQISDISTAIHETAHAAEEMGFFEKDEIKAINKTIKKETGKEVNAGVKGKETRANWLDKAVDQREKYRGTKVGRIIQRIIDMVDGVVNLFHQTSLGAVRSFESGKVFDRKGGSQKSNGLGKSPTYSLKEATKNTIHSQAFKKWFGDWESSAANTKFNSDIKKMIDGDLPIEHIFNIGKPSGILNDAGVPNYDIILTQSVLSRKKNQHEFNLSALKNLPDHINRTPLAVFDAKDQERHPGAKVILTEIKQGGKYIVAALHVQRERNKLIVNEIRSLHSRPDSQYQGWVEKGLLRSIDKNKGQWMLEREGRAIRPMTSTVLAPVKHIEHIGDEVKISVVVDENGKPLVVYHGTNKNFERFYALPDRQLGAHFSSNPKIANEFAGATGQVYPVYLRLQNPYDIVSDLGVWDDMGMLEEYLSEANEGPFTDREFSKFKTPEDVRDGLIEKGYDGIKYQNSFEGETTTGMGSEGQDSYIAFSPTQIKSAIGNNGEFDSGNPNILYQAKDISKKTKEKAAKDLQEDTLDILGQDDTIDKELAKHAQKEIDRIKKNLQNIGRKEPAIAVSEKKTLDLIKKYVQIRQKLKDPNRDLETRIKEFKDYLMTMPENVRAKAMKSFPKLANAKTPETRAKYFKQIQKQTQKYLHDYFKRQALKDIHKLRKSGRLTKQGEVKRGGVMGPDAIATLEKLNRVVFAEGVLRGDNKPLRTAESAEKRISEYNRRITKLKDTQAGIEKKQFDSIQKKIDELEENKYLVSMFGGYRDMTLDEMQRAYEALDFIIANSKTKWRMQQEMFKAEVGKMMNIVAQDVTGEENPEPEDYIDRKHREESMTAVKRITRKLSQFDTIHQSWRFLMDKISTKGEGKTLRTKTVKELGGRIHAATNHENQLNEEMSDMMSNKLNELTGLEGRKLSNWVNKNSFKIKDDYEVALPTGTKTLSMAPFQAAYVWSVSKRAEALEVENIHGLRQRLDNQGITREVIRKIEKTVDPKILEMAQWLSDNLGGKVHENVNPVHEAVFGAPLTRSESYIPIKADYGRGSVDESGMLEKGEPKISMVKSAMKELSNTSLGIKADTNLLDVWIDHIYDMNHFAAWGIPIKEVSAVFSNTEIRNFIKKEHGPHMTASIDQFVEHFKSGTKKRKEMFRGLDRLRANFTTAVLGLNPTIFFKQLGSFNAMAENISTVELIVGTNEFFKNPKKAMDIIANTQFAKTRKRRGHTRDVAQALSQTAGQAMGQIQGLKNQTMFMTRMGDKVPIYIGGYAVYSTFYKKYKAEGMSNQQAHEEAVKEFEITASETQQSGETMHLGLAQHSQMGAIQKLFTMFMTAPTSYYRHIGAAIRNMKKSPRDSAKRLMLFWVAMPAIFEAISSAPLMSGDDEDKELLLKRMGRSIALGPINGLFIARDIASAIYNQLWMTEEGWMDPQYSPVVDVGDNVVKLAKEIGQGMRDEWDWAETFEPINDLLGELTGLPTIGGKRLMEGWMDDDTEHPVARKLGYGMYATNRK